MKRKFLLILSIVAIMCCFLAITVSAEKEITGVTHTYYVVANQESETALALKAEGKDVIVLSEVYASTTALSDTDWVAQFNEGDHIELVFAENVIESVGDKLGILLNKDITLTVRYNGFCHLITNGSRENVFVLRHCDAKLNLIGTSEIYDENGDVITDFTYNTSDLSKNNIQVNHGKVYTWVFDGDVYVENLRAKAGQEVVFSQDDNDTSDSKTNTYEFVDCAFTSGSHCIGLDGKGNARKIIKINGGYYNSVYAYTVCDGSYMQNCEIGKFIMDCWDITNQTAVFENCTIGSITTSTGRTHLKIIDCDFDVSKLSLGSDGGGKGYALVYTSATCENDGILNVYRNGSATPVNDDSRYASVVTEFYADPQNKATGHDISWSFEFEGEKYLSACTATEGCSRCGNAVTIEKIDSMFIPVGYSVPEFGDQLYITAGFMLDQDAIAKYSILSGSTVSYGAVIALEATLGRGNAPLDSEGNAVQLEKGQVVKADATAFVGSCAMDVKVIIPAEHIDTSILISGYIIETKDEVVSVSYMQEGDSLIADNVFTYVSYNNH